tara:strand:- start:6945 stop:10280 length:3336 start_codon:yes stop_codon:yes gene_type:complete
MTLSSVLMVETKASSASLLREHARQNAILGLHQALGNLQKLAGPDQRVTARADILETYEDAIDTEETVQNPYYTAVWNVEPTDATRWPHSPGQSEGPDPKVYPSFLVSGNEGHDWMDSEAPINESTSTFQDPVTFDDIAVTVEKSAVLDDGGRLQGNYGWWIGDEGVKARLTTEEPQSALTDTVPEWTRPAGTTPQLIDSSLRSIDREDYQETAWRIREIEELKLADGLFQNLFDPVSPSVEKPYFHDFTGTSLGVLADTRSGGLKKDLAVALSTPSATAPVGTRDDDPLYPSFSEGNYQVFDPTWGYLRDYFTGVPLLTNTTAQQLNDESWAKSKLVAMRMPDGTKPGILPITVRAQTGITPVLVQMDPTSWTDATIPEWEIYYYYQPSLVLWNPYNVAIELPELVAMTRPYVGSGSLNLNDGYNITVTVTIDGSSDVTSDAQSKLPALKFTLPPTVIPAGRAVIFSPLAGDALLEEDAANNPLPAGWRPDGTFYQGTGITFAWDPDGSGSTPTILLNTATGSDAAQNYGPFRTSNGMWDLLHTPPTGPLVTDQNDFATQLINIAFRTTQNLLSFSASQARRVTDPNFVDNFEGGTLSFPALLQSVAMKFSDDDSGYPSGLNLGFTRTRWAHDFNPRTEFSTAWSSNLPTVYAQGLFFNTDAQSAFSIPLAQDDTNPDPSFYPVGGRINDLDITRATLYEIPTEDTVQFNIASLRHANLSSSQERPVGGSHPRGGQQYAPAFTLGSSNASPMIPSEDVSVDAESAYGYSVRMFLPDLSYLANDALYDRYFLSALDNSGSTSLHPILRPTDVTYPSTSGFDENAAAWLIDGGFNVNSTSIEAWTAFLGSLLDTSVELEDSSSDAGSGAPFTRFTNPTGDTLTTADMGMGESAMLSDFRRLDDEQIRALAEAVVEEVKIRGPFLSMSSFVNRVRADPDSNWALNGPIARDDVPLTRKNELVSKGALQAALDRSDTNTLPNYTLVTDSDSTAQVNLSGTYNTLANPETLDGVATQGLPGYLMQHDILGALDSAMTVRSDTFRIVVFGEVVDPITGNSLVEARCEAVVQRLPDYVSADNDAWDPPYNSAYSPTLSTLNQSFGRRFTILSFEWVN